MNILGIDPSFTSTGAVVLNEQGEIIHQEEIKTKPRQFPTEMGRLVHIRDRIARIIKDHDVKKVGIEGYSYGSRLKSRFLFQAGELGGMLRILFHDQQIEYVDVPPKTLKKFCTGNGNADKPEMLRVVKEKYGIDFGTKNDLADAYGLGLMAIHKFIKLGDFKFPKKPKVKKIIVEQ